SLRCGAFLYGPRLAPSHQKQPRERQQHPPVGLYRIGLGDSLLVPLEESRLLLGLQRLQERQQCRGLEPLHYRSGAIEYVEIGGAPDIQFAGVGTEDVVVGLHAMPLGMTHLTDLRRPGPVSRYLAGQSVGRFLQIVGRLDRQPATGRQLRQQSRIKPGVIRQPLQRGVGQDQLWRSLSLPGLDIRELETDLRQARTRRTQHVIAAVDTDHLRVWRMRLQYRGGIAGAAAQVHGQFDAAPWHGCEQVMYRAGTLAFK